jgi:protein involved in polysaccharide export with SLBB domain
VLEDRDPPKSLLLAESGDLDAPYVGRVPADGVTCKQLASVLKTELEKEYYYQATVIIGLESSARRAGRVYVWGQVRNRGPIDLAPNESLTVAQAILKAGGFVEGANKKKVKVVRGGADGSAKESFELNMAEILDDGKTEKDVPLRPDDFVIVP